MGPVCQSLGGATPLIIGSLLAAYTRTTMTITILILTLNLIALGVLICWTTESAKFLYANGRYSECRVVLTKMANVNGVNVEIT
jgi:hypothetical protein